jgi:four helix bundle protein
MFSPPTHKDTTPCSSQRAEYEKKNTEHRTSNAGRRIIRWIGDGRVKEDAPVYGATRQSDSTPNAQRRIRGTTHETHMKIKRKTPNTERRTSNTEWKGPLFRVNEASSEYAAPKKKRYDLEDRLLDFAVAVVELTDDLPSTRAGNHIAGQLLRCGTSPYGHHGEVESAESRKDFIHKLKVCLKELRETRRWLRLVSRLKKMNRDPRSVACLAEAEELIRIFVASVRTTERRRL